jgi:hypothetical protein
VDFPKAGGLVAGPGPANHGCMGNDSWFAGARQPIHDPRNAKPGVTVFHRGLSMKLGMDRNWIGAIKKA